MPAGKNIKQDLEIKPVKWIDEVFQLALQHMPQPRLIEGETTTTPRGGAKKAAKGKKGSQIRAH